MIARRIRITGKVQGVFFRDWTMATAQELDITGWVRNRRDGGVETLAIGDPDAVDRFIAKLHGGSPASRVDHVEAEDTEVESHTGFTRRPTG